MRNMLRSNFLLEESLRTSQIVPARRLHSLLPSPVSRGSPLPLSDRANMLGKKNFPNLDTLNGSQLQSYLELYPQHVARISDSQQRFVSRYFGYPGATLSVLDRFLAFLGPSESSLKVEKQPNARKILFATVGWLRLRQPRLNLAIDPSTILRNGSARCSVIFRRAIKHLKKHDKRLNLDTPTEELLQIVEQTMRILRELKGSTIPLCSAIVACWSPDGIFQSNELAGCVMQTKELNWDFYRSFYRKAMAMLKLHQSVVLTGRGLERVAWSMVRNADETPSTGSQKHGQVQGRGEEAQEGQIRPASVSPTVNCASHERLETSASSLDNPPLKRKRDAEAADQEVNNQSPPEQSIQKKKRESQNDPRHVENNPSQGTIPIRFTVHIHLPVAFGARLTSTIDNGTQSRV